MDLVFIVKTSLSSPALTGSMFEEKIMDNGDDVESFKSSATKVDPAVPASLTWQRKIDSEAKMPRGFNLTAKEIFHMSPTGIRLWFLAREEAAKGRLAFIDPFTKYSVTSSHGVPLGGIGGGSIGRSFKGEFQRWQIFPPKCEDEPVLANQFSHQFVAVTEWSGGLYVSPTITGSRPGSLVAGAWAAMMYLGEEGFTIDISLSQASVFKVWRLVLRH